MLRILHEDADIVVVDKPSGMIVHPAPGRREKALSDELVRRYRDDEGVFRPHLLAQVIFSDSEALKKVEALVFPALQEDFEAFRKANADEEVIIFESATILEKPQFDGFGDVTVLVDAPLKTRLERACERDKASAEAVQARMASQPLMNSLSQGDKDPRVDYVLANTSGLAELEQEVDKLMLNIYKQID